MKKDIETLQGLFELIDDAKKEFSIEKFKVLIERISKFIIDGKYEKTFPRDNLQIEMERKFDLLFGTSSNNEYYENVQKDIVVEFAELCQKSNKKFYLNKVFKSYLRMCILNDFPENKKINFMHNIKEYLKYMNEEYLLINERNSYFLINAVRIKKSKYHEKIKNILKGFRENYDLKQYEEVIDGKKTLRRIPFFDFIREVNKVKIDTWLIPLNVCEYLISEMLKPNSVISSDYEFWADLRECVFCDFISHIQIKDYKVHDYFNYIKKSEDRRGNHSKNKKSIYIDENIIYNFKKENVRAIITAMHELVHFEQDYLIREKDYGDIRYKILKERILIDNIKNFRDKNYWYICSEIQAREEGIIRAIDYLKRMGQNIDELKIQDDISDNPEVISLSKYKQIVLDDCEKSRYQSYCGDKKLNVNNKLNKILQNNPSLIKENQILKYEYNEDGTRKNIHEIILGLSQAIERKELSRESVKGIFRYSVLEDMNIQTKGLEKKIRNIKSYEYPNEKIKVLCYDALDEKIKDNLAQLKYLEDDKIQKTSKNIEINIV